MVIAKHIFENQLKRLGLLSLDDVLDNNIKLIFSLIWANNGDAISRQYAGTRALKSDFTKTGQRKIGGMFKDGVVSANRFYLRFKDQYRTMSLQILQGVHAYPRTSTNSRFNATNNSSNSNNNNGNELLIQNDLIINDELQVEREENIKQLVVDCRKQLIDVNEDCFGSWALIDCNE
jgi:phosphatidylinositol 4-phosphatase